MFVVEGLSEGSGEELVDPRGMSPGELRAVFAELEVLRRRVEAAAVAVIAEADRSGAYAVDGHRSVAGWCRAGGGWSKTESIDRARVARLAAVSEVFAAALAQGRIPVAHAVVLGWAFANPRCGERLPADVEVLLEHAEISSTGSSSWSSSGGCHSPTPTAPTVTPRSATPAVTPR